METSVTKKPLTLGIVTRVLRLSKLQIRTLFNMIMQQATPPETDPLPDHWLALLITADLLERLEFLRPEQRTLILTDLWSSVFNNDYSPDIMHQLLFADGRYCVWTGQTRFLDLETGEPVVEPEHPILESVGYNLSELCRRERLRIEKRSGLHAKKHHAGSVDEQGNVRLSVVNDIRRSLRDGGVDMESGNNPAGD